MLHAKQMPVPMQAQDPAFLLRGQIPVGNGQRDGEMRLKFRYESVVRTIDEESWCLIRVAMQSNLPTSRRFSDRNLPTRADYGNRMEARSLAKR